MHSLDTLAPGDACHVLTCHHCTQRVCYLAVVVRLTPQMIVVKNERGNLRRYWRKDGGAVGGNRTLGKPHHWLVAGFYVKPATKPKPAPKPKRKPATIEAPPTWRAAVHIYFAAMARTRPPCKVWDDAQREMLSLADAADRQAGVGIARSYHCHREHPKK